MQQKALTFAMKEGKLDSTLSNKTGKADEVSKQLLSTYW